MAARENDRFANGQVVHIGKIMAYYVKSIRVCGARYAIVLMNGRKEVVPYGDVT